MTSTLPPIVQAFSGAIGSAAAGALTYPLELVTTRVQLQDPNKKGKQGGLRDLERTLRHIIRKYGVTGLYDGLSVDTVAKVLSRLVHLTILVVGHGFLIMSHLVFSTSTFILGCVYFRHGESFPCRT